MRLKSWESPRRQGRNDKGKGGSARQRQVRKQMKMLKQKLKEGANPTDGQRRQKESGNKPLSFFVFIGR